MNQAASGTVSEASEEAAAAAVPTTEEKGPGLLSDWARRQSARDPRFLYVLWGIAALLWLLVPISLYFAWWLGFPWLWRWVGDDWLRGALGVGGSIVLFVIPVWAGMIASSVTRFVAGVDLESESAHIAAARERVRETEEDALKRLETTDQANLLPLLRYSRAQLDAYYAIGLAQTRRSFVNAVIAMWLGFLILILGVALYVGPVETLGLSRPSEDFNILILSSAAIVEFISALFLWVYRSTINQLTFYYRLQMRSHTAILCFRMSTTMENADLAKRAIITSMLDSSLVPEPTPPTGSKGFASLIGARPA